MLLLEQLNHTSGLSEGQRTIARWLVAHRDEMANVTTKEIARQTFTSPAAVVRLAKNLGYDGFEPLRRELMAEAAYLNRNFRSVDANRPFDPGDKPLTVAAKVAALARETAQDTLSLMEADDLERAVALMAQARVVHVAATSFPLLYAQDFQLKMRRLGKMVEVCTLVGEPLFTEGTVDDQDCAIVISYSGTTPATLEMARMYHRRGIPLIALTSMGCNPLRELADVTLTLTTRERLYSKAGGFTSETSIKLVLDTLYACYLCQDAERLQAMKDELSSHAEPGRTSDSEILREAEG